MTKYIIGIDLGTTNCTMAYAPSGGDVVEITQFSIPQITSSGTQEEHCSLPSFHYFPLQEELKAKIAAIEWDGARAYCVGTFARDRGSEVSSRLISSAKSWLCHSGIDRRAKLLPLTNDEKMSPLEACSALLTHLKESWDSKMTKAPFQKQQVFITVPASFDPSARQLVQEAATMANFPEIVLLEEPLAAFYSWIQANEDSWRNQLSVGDSVLVIDIGGGTTDFSLISVENEEGNLVLQRQAVGSHLLLGGDNIDLSLAYLAKGKLEDQGHNIDEWQLQSLVHACRKAKEKLMGENPSEAIDITLMGKSSKLIGNTLKTHLTREETHNMVIGGFIPLTDPKERSPTEKRMGFQQIGLPYAQDARISCQLAKFLSMTGEIDSNTMDRFVIPSAVLFNGGTLKSSTLRDRLIELLNGWAKMLDKPPIKVLPNGDLDYAVSRGAAYYGFARTGKGIRIKSGTSRSYYIGVEEAMPAVPGMSAPLKAVCIVPYGLEEGSELDLPHQEFALVVGEPATFRFFSHATKQLSNGHEPNVGTIVKNWKQELTELPTIETRLEKSEHDGKTIRVCLKSKVTELGVLELWCVAPDGRQWKLEFDVRKGV